jgi:hypothetical protein
LNLDSFSHQSATSLQGLIYIQSAPTSATNNTTEPFGIQNFSKKTLPRHDPLSYSDLIYCDQIVRKCFDVLKPFLKFKIRFHWNMIMKLSLAQIESKLKPGYCPFTWGASSLKCISTRFFNTTSINHIYFSHLRLVTYFFPTSPIKLKLGLQKVVS